MGTRRCHPNLTPPTSSPPTYPRLTHSCPAFTHTGKSVSAASAMLSRKAAGLKANTESLAKVVSTKRANLEAVTSMLEERTAQAPQQQQGGGGGR